MKIEVNGRERDVPEGASLHDFILGTGVKPEGVIAELNRRVMGRDLWKETLLSSGDSLELVSLVGGG
ncbi:MAG TPA: sulfur carrier protein ThiS [Syntrophorhabdaceae bacterium]